MRHKMMQTVGNRYAQPGWWGLGGLIVSAMREQESKTNLRKAQLQYMRVCLEGRSWVVNFKGEAATLMGAPVDLSARPASDQMPESPAPPPVVTPVVDVYGQPPAPAPSDAARRRKPPWRYRPISLCFKPNATASFGRAQPVAATSAKDAGARVSDNALLSGPVFNALRQRWLHDCEIMLWAEVESLTPQQMEWLWRCRTPTKSIPLDVVQVLLREELTGRTYKGDVGDDRKRARACLHRDDSKN